MKNFAAGFCLADGQRRKTNFMKASYPYPSGQSTLADAKARLNIHGLWRHFGFDGELKANCRSPFRDDNKPSFSVNAGGTLWNDFSTGEAGDAVDFFQRASGLSQKAACRKFIELAAGHFTPAPQAARPQCTPVEAKPKPVFPAFRNGTADEIKHLASLRNIGCDGLGFASERGLLRFATLKDCTAWIVTDSARVNAQARRMDGQDWEHIGAKAWTLPGSWASWPIGITEGLPFPAIAVCEGGPDFLAAHYLALWEQSTHHAKRDARCAPVAMLGASQRIHTDALPLFAGKRVRIFGHDDEAGKSAMESWARQLASVGADVDAFTFAGLRQVDGKPVKDLNDSLLMGPASFAEAERILP
jgi:CHC2 zinc finger